MLRERAGGEGEVNSVRTGSRWAEVRGHRARWDPGALFHPGLKEEDADSLVGRNKEVERFLPHDGHFPWRRTKWDYGLAPSVKLEKSVTLWDCRGAERRGSCVISPPRSPYSHPLGHDWHQWSKPEIWKSSSPFLLINEVLIAQPLSVSWANPLLSISSLSFQWRKQARISVINVIVMTTGIGCSEYTKEPVSGLRSRGWAGRWSQKKFHRECDPSTGSWKVSSFLLMEKWRKVEAWMWAKAWRCDTASSLWTCKSLGKPLVQRTRLCVCVCWGCGSEKRDSRRKQRPDVEVLGSILKAMENNWQVLDRRAT